jgi:hypothetical protein
MKRWEDYVIFAITITIVLVWIVGVVVGWF